MEKLKGQKPLEQEAPEKKLEQALIWTEGFDSSRRIIGLSGNIALATDKGLRASNQDALVLDLKNDGFAVVDGMGGYAKGEVAAQIVAESIIKNNPLEIELKNLEISKAIKAMENQARAMQFEAFQNMRKQGMHEGGAVYLAGRIERNGKELSICQAGDAKLIVVDSNGKIKFASEPTSLRDAPSASGAGFAAIETGVKLGNYDCILAATDGLWDNIKADEAAQIVAKEKVETALVQLAELAKKRMAEGFGNGEYGNKDNLTIFIYKILPVPLRGK